MAENSVIINVELTDSDYDKFIFLKDQKFRSSKNTDAVRSIIRELYDMIKQIEVPA